MAAPPPPRPQISPPGPPPPPSNRPSPPHCPCLNPPSNPPPPPRGGLRPISTGGGGGRVQKRGDGPPVMAGIDITNVHLRERHFEQTRNTHMSGTASIMGNQCTQGSQKALDHGSAHRTVPRTATTSCLCWNPLTLDLGCGCLVCILGSPPEDLERVAKYWGGQAFV